MVTNQPTLRWQMSYTGQTEEIRAAIRFPADELTVDTQRIGIMGSSYAGVLVTDRLARTHA